VSLSINYCMKSLEKRARVYQANYILRKLGLNSLPPGISPLRDSLKRGVISTLEHRNPKSFSDVVYTPVSRLISPLNAVRRLVRRGPEKVSAFVSDAIGILSAGLRKARRAV